jgi:5,10-methenyltetrahydromethanopterin hydrogenase
MVANVEPVDLDIAVADLDSAGVADSDVILAWFIEQACGTMTWSVITAKLVKRCS